MSQQHQHHHHATTTAIPFPRTMSESSHFRDNHRDSMISVRESRFSVNTISNRATALGVYDLVYGSAVSSPADVKTALDRMYEPNAIYENPLMTATSRSIITDIHTLTRQISDVEVPKPIAMFSLLFRRGGPRKESWFPVLKCWSEIGEVAESESWDASRKSIIEHTVHILLLPGIHSDVPKSETISSETLDMVPAAMYGGQQHGHHTTQPSLAVSGVSVPSPFHLTLRVITKLTFNEQGRITAHRDVWDLKDVIGLLPGAQAAQWVTSRLAAKGLSSAVHFGTWLFGLRASESEEMANVLGLTGVGSGPGTPDMGSREQYRRRAPDTDRDSQGVVS